MSDAPRRDDADRPPAPRPWPAAFRQRVRLLQRLLGLLFTLAGVLLIYLGLGPLTRHGAGWLTAVGVFCLLAGVQAVLLGPYYLSRLESHRQAPG